jgi:Na+/H+ antiporter NhaB
MDRKTLMAAQVHRFELIFKRAMASECYPSAVGALNALNNMLGIGFSTK